MLGVLGIDGDVNPALYLLAMGVLLIWFGLVHWIHVDARKRIRRPALVIGATILAMSVVGALVYMIVRPSLDLEDVREREMSIKSSEALIDVLADLRREQADVRASVQRLEQALLDNRQQVVSQARAGAPASGAAEPAQQN